MDGIAQKANTKIAVVNIVLFFIPNLSLWQVLTIYIISVSGIFANFCIYDRLMIELSDLALMPTKKRSSYEINADVVLYYK
jgi:hypothetical protein